MHERSSVGVLGCIAAALALCALAGVRQRSRAERAEPVAPRSAAAATHALAPASPEALRALRIGQALDLNQVQATDLELLPGIGPKLAQRVVEYRRAHGPFANVQALEQVRGIGPRTLERLHGLLQVTPAR
jgi:competence protein ComEA